MNQDTDVVCLSHRRFGPTCGRANQLMMRFARERRTFFVEEPLFDVDEAQLEDFLGAKAYAELPSYLAGWDAAMLPYRVDGTTRFVSTTKALELLAAGKPVVSTSLPEVMPFGERGAVRIADADTFVAHIEEALATRGESTCEAGDALVARTSWDQTFRQMSALVHDTALAKKELAIASARFAMQLPNGMGASSDLAREQP